MDFGEGLQGLGGATVADRMETEARGNRWITENRRWIIDGLRMRLLEHVLDASTAAERLEEIQSNQAL